MMNEPRKRLPIALTIAGSDSGGGAGIQADLKTFAALAVHGTSVLTCITAQNPAGVLGVQACSKAIVEAQLTAIFSELPPAAAKTGMLFSSGIIQAVADFLSDQKTALVLDPVMVATSGARLLKSSAISALKRRLLPRASLVTPNLDEAEILIGKPLNNLQDLRHAAKWIYENYGCAALVKGGHLKSCPDAVDVFYDGKEESILRSAFVRGVNTHGTGCTYSAAITAHLALGESLPIAVRKSKRFITEAIRGSARIARHSVLNWSSAGKRAPGSRC